VKKAADEARPPRPPKRTAKVFLDANVLYSAAYLAGSKLGDLWNLSATEIVTSFYGVEEARRNLASDRPEALVRFDALLRTTRVVPEAEDEVLPRSIELDPKDRPILLAAMSARADYLFNRRPLALRKAVRK
jgi:predicted nucleic acid-binding protein